jgi:Fe-S cluster assembly protein SufD
MTIQISPTEVASGSGAAVRSAYLTNLLNLRQDLDPAANWLQTIRDRATAIVQELAIPSTRDEDWRFTDLAGLLKVNFQAVEEASDLSFAEIQPFLLPEAVNSRLVFVNGIYDPTLSCVDDLPDGVVVCNLLTIAALMDGPEAEMVDTLPSYLAGFKGSEEVFTALNTASLTDGAIVWVPNEQEVGTPIQILYVATATQTTIAHPRCLVVVESDSQLTLIEDFVSLHEGVYLTNAVTEILIDDNAEVNHTRVQRDSTDAFHIGKTVVSQARDSRYTCNAISLGAKLSRHNLEVHQNGEQTETTLNGLTMLAGEQVGDTHSTIAFTKPYGTSNQLHKCIVDDRARAVFNGKIFVPKPAQLTNAAQLSRTLLLSPKARVDTKPQLEITADNVKCAHGATVSQLEDDEVFYLQSRGINHDEARKLLVYAFAHEVINQVPVESLRQVLSREVAVET